MYRMLGWLFIKLTFSAWRKSIPQLWRAVLTFSFFITILHFVTGTLFRNPEITLIVDEGIPKDTFYFLAFIAIGKLFFQTFFDVAVYQKVLENRQSLGYGEMLKWSLLHWRYLAWQMILLFLIILLMVCVLFINQTLASVLGSSGRLLSLILFFSGLYFWFRFFPIFPAIALGQKVSPAYLFSQMKGKVAVQFSLAGAFVFFFSVFLGFLFSSFTSSFFISVFNIPADGSHFIGGSFFLLPIIFFATMGWVFSTLLNRCFLFVIFNLFAEEQGIKK